MTQDHSRHRSFTLAFALLSLVLALAAGPGGRMAGAASRKGPRPILLPVRGHILVDVALGRDVLRSVLERHPVPRPEAADLAALLEADRYREADIGAGRTMQHWDLRFADGQSVRDFLDLARWPLIREGWTVNRDGSYVRLLRRGEGAPPIVETGIPPGSPPASPAPGAGAGSADRESSRGPVRRIQEPDPLERLPVRGHVLTDRSLGPDPLVRILVEHLGSGERAADIAALVAADRYRETDIGAGRTMRHWDLRFLDEKSTQNFLDGARWPLLREGWSVDRRGRILRLHQRVGGMP